MQITQAPLAPPPNPPVGVTRGPICCITGPRGHRKLSDHFRLPSLFRPFCLRPSCTTTSSLLLPWFPACRTPQSPQCARPTFSSASWPFSSRHYLVRWCGPAFVPPHRAVSGALSELPCPQTLVAMLTPSPARDSLGQARHLLGRLRHQHPPAHARLRLSPPAADPAART